VWPTGGFFVGWCSVLASDWVYVISIIEHKFIKYSCKNKSVCIGGKHPAGAQIRIGGIGIF